MIRSRKLSKILPLLSGLYNAPEGLVKKLEGVFPYLDLNKPEIGQNFHFYGKPGTGKTVYSLGLVISYLRQPKIALTQSAFYYVSVPSLLSGLRNYYSKSKNNPKFGVQDDGFGNITAYDERIINKGKGAKILIIDDLGANKNTEWSNEVLYNIIDYRYNYGGIVLVTSNLSFQESNASIGDDRIISRLSDMCTSINFKKQYRK